MSTLMQPKIPRTMAITLIAILLNGCGSKGTNRDWAKSVNGRGLANVWGVVFRVEKIDGETSITSSGTFGESQEETDATNEIVFGDVVVKLEAVDNEKFKLIVNGKRYGTVIKGNQVLVDPERQVFVNQKPREPVKTEK